MSSGSGVQSLKDIWAFPSINDTNTDSVYVTICNSVGLFGGAATSTGDSVVISRDHKASDKSFSDQIADVMAAFSLSVTELAIVMNVERRTIYNWMGESEPIGIRSANVERASRLVEFAEYWRKVSLWHLPKGLKKVPLLDGKSLMELLSAEELVSISTFIKYAGDLQDATIKHRAGESGKGEIARKRRAEKRAPLDQLPSVDSFHG